MEGLTDGVLRFGRQAQDSRELGAWSLERVLGSLRQAQDNC